MKTPCCVFLDFDGVLNRGKGPGEPDLVARLNTITARTGAVIVVHSSWRWDRTLSHLRYILRSWGVTGQVEDKCPSALTHTLNEAGMWVAAGDWNAFRGDIESKDERCIAIQRWLNDHPEVTKYVIIDDSDHLGHFVGQPEFIQTRTREGLTDEHVTKAICHLQGITW